MTEWTTERLEALHEGTSVALWAGGSLFTKDASGDPARPWAFSRGGRESSAGLIREFRNPDTGQGWIRVVSVPVDALLGFPAFADDLLSGSDPWIRDGIPQVAELILRAAIANVTGEAL